MVGDYHEHVKCQGLGNSQQMCIELSIFTFAQPAWPFFIALFISYIALVRFHRYKRARGLERNFVPLGRASFSSLTTNQAQAVLKDLIELEFPKFFGFSIIFALFKTYGIPSVSSLLVATGQLASKRSASKRIADTGVILLELALNEPTSDRAIQAIARMNFLHAPYQKSGKITNDDMLYTLSLFALEPARWVEKYDWRNLTELEVAACGTYWKSMGDAMGISFSGLPSYRTGWKDGFHWLTEVGEWSLHYETAYMVPAKTNQQLADSHFEILCINVPTRYHAACKRVMSVLLGTRLQRAMMYPEPSKMLIWTVELLLLARKLVVRHLALPRPNFMRKKYIPSSPDPQTGRYNALEYLSYPWYVKPTFARRWGPMSWLTRLLGRKLPGDDGNQYAPEGWVHTALGPKKFEGKGRESMEKERERLLALNRGECPFHPVQIPK